MILDAYLLRMTNPVVQKWSEQMDSRANILMQVPGGQLAYSDYFGGPLSVIVCCEDQPYDAPQHRVPIPCWCPLLEDTNWELTRVNQVPFIHANTSCPSDWCRHFTPSSSPRHLACYI